MELQFFYGVPPQLLPDFPPGFMEYFANPLFIAQYKVIGGLDPILSQKLLGGGANSPYIRQRHPLK